MKKHLKSIKNIKEQEKDINNIIPDIIFLYSMIKKENFIEKINVELMSKNEMNTATKIFLYLIFLLSTSPIWLISGFFNFKYNIKFFSVFFISNYIYSESVKENQKKVIEKYNEEIKKYHELTNKENYFTYLESIEYSISREEFDILTIKNDIIIDIDNKFKELYLSFEKNPEKFTEYFNVYVNARRDSNEDLNFIAKSLNEHILKNSIERNKKKEGIKLNKADIIDFDKYHK